MSRIDALPDDQRAVLQLVLRQGRRYDQLSGLLRIDEAAVRRRAHAAVDALAPDRTGDLPAERRHAIADYLLGQDAEEQRLVTYSFLEGSAEGRAWARAVAAELGTTASGPLPEIPGGDHEAATAESEPAPAPAAGAFGAADRTPRSSRRGGAILLGGLALVAVAAVLFLVLGGGDGDGGSDDATPAANTTSSQAEAEVVAQANLTPPSTRKDLKALGVVLVQRAQGKNQIVAAVQGLPKPKSGGYGIWLYSGPGKAQWLGFFASQDNEGRLLARGELKAPVEGYREVLVTREPKGDPPQPGPVFLRGPIQTPTEAGGG
jgi:anti-sigma-K factor RskA